MTSITELVPETANDYSVTTRHFLTTAAVCLLATAIAFTLAETLDAPWLRLLLYGR